MTDQKGLEALGFSKGERNLFMALASFAVIFLVILALPALTREGTVTAEAGGANGAQAATVRRPVQEVSVVMTDFEFEPASFSFEAGDRVRFAVENQGKVPHEFRLTSRTSVDAHIEGGHDHDESAETSGDVDESADASGDVWVLASPGETQMLEVTFTTDTTYDLVACLLPGHFEAGMSGPLSIAGTTAIAAAHDDAAHADEATHDEEGEAESADREIAVTMTEFAFEPEVIEVNAGETIRFLLDNQGVIQHEFRLSSQHAVDEHLASGHEGHDDEGSEATHGHGDVIVLVDGGETAEVIVTFDEGTEFEVMACLLPDHYEAGMWGTVTVTG